MNAAAKTRILDHGTQNRKKGVIRRITVDWNGATLTFDQPLTPRQALVEANALISMVAYHQLPVEETEET